jgi:general secretion pathway protein C
MVITALSYFSVDIFYKAVAMQLLGGTVKASTINKSKGYTAVPKPPPSTYTPISERNLFGSERTATADVQINVEELEPTKLDLELIGTVSGTGDFDYAVIEEKKKRKQGLFKVGDPVADATIIKILKGKVILRIGGKDEVLLMKETYAGQSKPAQGSVAQGQAGGSIQVSKADIDSAFQNMNDMLTQVRVRPYFSGGKPDGFMVSQIKRGSIFEKMGLKNGDVIRGVNGEALQSAEKMLDLYSTMKSGAEVTLNIKRRGKEEDVRYVFQ